MHRRSSKLLQGGALLLALVAILAAPAVYADDPPNPFNPPQSRISIPGGIAAQQETPTILDLFWAWLQARLGPPTG